MSPSHANKMQMTVLVTLVTIWMVIVTAILGYTFYKVLPDASSGSSSNTVSSFGTINATLLTIQNNLQTLNQTTSQTIQSMSIDYNDQSLNTLIEVTGYYPTTSYILNTTAADYNATASFNNATTCDCPAQLFYPAVTSGSIQQQNVVNQVYLSADFTIFCQSVQLQTVTYQICKPVQNPCRQVIIFEAQFNIGTVDQPNNVHNLVKITRSYSSIC